MTECTVTQEYDIAFLATKLVHSCNPDEPLLVDDRLLVDPEAGRLLVNRWLVAQHGE